MGKMGSEMLIYVLLLMAGVLASGQSSQVKIWPMPASVSYGHTHLYLTNDFGFSSNYGSEILKDAFDRMLALIKLDHVIDANFSAFNSSSLLQGLHIVISSPNGQLQYDVDESYKLIVPSPEKPAYAHLEAKTVYGALQGLQIRLVTIYLCQLLRRLLILCPMQSCYAQKRGINVLAEIDVPGHALSWGTGYPSLWPSKDCQQPLDVSNEFTFKVIDGILSGCWTTTPRIRNWLKKRGMNESQAYQYFVLRAQNIALSHGYEIINWLGGGVAQRVVASGLRCIVSNQDKWYLDHLDTPWQEFYANEPLTNITNLKQQKLVIGGEVCMWGETVDGSDIEQTIWPRAAAAAERLWTPFDKLAKNPRDVTGRLAHFRCLLNQRGVAAAPVAGLGRAAPEGPGSCYRQ
ncbi:hexa[2]: Beta-hexosaminidase subunit A1 [Gossypium arboreum]|uniref:beta-N-acetylhexosaminidase n=1 Tax=Gossypium arboreum TaxID=29729 RepID=A0A0B0P9D7_GOSAR|nr:hexa[2]: Beta-hexosaminidase subunit A1 [Gossypium arboreum]